MKNFDLCVHRRLALRGLRGGVLGTYWTQPRSAIDAEAQSKIVRQRLTTKSKIQNGITLAGKLNPEDKLVRITQLLV
jgi:hypothetical protein